MAPYGYKNNTGFFLSHWQLDITVRFGDGGPGLGDAPGIKKQGMQIPFLSSPPPALQKSLEKDAKGTQALTPNSLNSVKPEYLVGSGFLR